MAESILSQGGIYAVRNTINGKLYVGSAVNFARRFYIHKWRLDRGDHHSKKLQAAWVKHGASAFVFEVIEVVQDAADLIGREQHHIDRMGSAKSGYNMLPVAGSMLGMRHTKEAKEKIAAAFRGVPKKTPLVKKGQELPPEWVAKVAAANTGKKRTEETKRRISASAVGHKRWLGKTHSEETKARISALAKSREPRRGWRHSPDAIRKMSVRGRIPVIVDGVEYESYQAAALAIGCHPSSIGHWVKSGRAIRAGL